MNIELLPIEPEVAWVLLIEAAMVFAVGLAMIIWPGLLIRLQVAMLEWQRRVFGGFTVDWHLRLVRNRVAPWIVRLMGVFFVLCGIYLYASYAAVR
jgi:threonine/homoserine/homoserine lactone efflux protein